MVKRAHALARVIAAYTLSTVIGPIIGGFIVDYYSWHWAFLINLPIGILAIIMLQFSYYEDKQSQIVTKFDYLGASTLSMALIFLLFAGDALAVSQLRAITLLILGFGSLGIFVAVESHLDNPLFQLNY